MTTWNELAQLGDDVSNDVLMAHYRESFKKAKQDTFISRLLDNAYVKYCSWTDYIDVDINNVSIETAFKEFITDIHSYYPNRYLLGDDIDIENTQLVDLVNVNYVDSEMSSFIPTWDEEVNDLKYHISLGVQQSSTGKEIPLLYASTETTLSSIELPFEEGFYRVDYQYFDETKQECIDTNKPKHSFETYVYIKEDTPEWYNAIVFRRRVNGNQVINVQISLNERDADKFEIIGNIIALEEGVNPELEETVTSTLCACLSALIRSLGKINRLNHHSNIYRYKGETHKEKYKINGKKEYLRKTVYVYLDKKQEIPIEYTSSKLQRELSWKVRGHWRRLVNIKDGTIGKNARGIRDENNPILKKWTWVKEHMCGTGENFQPRTIIVKEGKECST